jgi:hypothetical protein
MAAEIGLTEGDVDFFLTEKPISVGVNVIESVGDSLRKLIVGRWQIDTAGRI